MYLEFFKMQRLPFRLTADPLFHFLFGERSIAKAQIKRAIEQSEGCVLIGGEAGIGKTVMMEDCLLQLAPDVKLAHIRHAELSTDEFFQAVLSQLEGEAAVSGAALQRFESSLSKQAQAGFRVLIAVDNADLMAPDLLDEVLKLAGRRRAAQIRVCVLLAARPALHKVLSRPQFDTIEKRPTLQIALQPFALDEIRRYLAHRLGVAGFNGQELFGEDACSEMLRFTGGVPRLVNTLADAVLTAAFTRGNGRIAGSEVRGVASQLGWVEYSVRPDTDTPHSQVEHTSPGYIRIAHQNRLVAECQLPLGKITLGRALRNDIRIESSFVSREHCRILTTASSSVIEDLQSQNGIHLNGKKIAVHRLGDGDVIQIGDHFLTYIKGLKPAAALPDPALMHAASKDPDPLTADHTETKVITPGHSSHDDAGLS